VKRKRTAGADGSLSQQSISPGGALWPSSHRQARHPFELQHQAQRNHDIIINVAAGLCPSMASKVEDDHPDDDGERSGEDDRQNSDPHASCGIIKAIKFA